MCNTFFVFGANYEKVYVTAVDKQEADEHTTFAMMKNVTEMKLDFGD